MASLYLNLPEPPWTYISRPGVSGRGPFTKLADPRWSAALLSYLKDVETLKTARRTATGNDEGAGNGPQKPNGGGRGKAPPEESS